MKVAIISDLHAQLDGAGDLSSSLVFSPLPGSSAPPIIQGLFRRIDEDNLNADLVLCPGDLCHRSDSVSLSEAWKWLFEIKNKLNAKYLIASAGNHDMNSRGTYEDSLPHDLLMDLEPRFPCGDENRHMEYFTKNYTIIEEFNFRLITFNSCMFHGIDSHGEEDYFERGRITDRILDKIVDDIKGRISTNGEKIQIFLCHHHLSGVPGIEDPRYGVMDGGDKILRVLGSGHLGRWLVVHGHKHVPYMFKSEGGGDAAYVFAAGSFSFRLPPNTDGITKNQFYIFDIENDSGKLRGTAKSWDYVFKDWKPSTRRSGVPHEFGFGYEDYNSIVGEIVDVVGDGQINASVLYKIPPNIMYLMPGDTLKLRDKLYTDYGLVTLVDERTGKIRQIAKNEALS